MRIKFWMRMRFEFPFARVVVAGAIIPGVTGWRLKLNGGQSIQRFFPFFRARAEKKNAWHVIRFRSRNMAHGEHDPVMTVIVLRVENAARRALAGHHAVRDRSRIRWYLNPAIERFAVEEAGGIFSISDGGTAGDCDCGQKAKSQRQEFFHGILLLIKNGFGQRPAWGQAK
jgi:hypothetical protein